MERNIFNNFISCLHKYFQFSGRSDRYEFISFFLMNLLIGIILGVAIMASTAIQMNGLVVLSAIFVSIALVIPYLSLVSRRMHDVGKSFWWVFIWPFVLGFVLFIFAVAFAFIQYSNIDFPGFAALRAIIFILGGFLLGGYPFFLSIYLIFKKGTEGSNKYGDPQNA